MNQPRNAGSQRVPASILAYDIETVSTMKMEDGSFPPWPSHHPVAIGFAQADRRDGEWAFELSALVAGADGDVELIRAADKRIGAADVTCSFNGRQFDALALRVAAQRRRLYGLQALADHAAANRFGSEHADLADLYASFGRKVSLSAICSEIGIPVKTSTTGGDVAALWAAGEKERIRDYVLEDAVATLVLWFSWTAARLADETLITRPLAALARHIERTPALHHLQPFVDCSLMAWARPRAMKADIAGALERITSKLAREEQERRFVRL